MITISKTISSEALRSVLNGHRFTNEYCVNVNNGRGKWGT
nr:MAG TPA: hypothetical protein [Caudoviricetes sp.]